jgi:hypothetical protein
MAKVINTVSDAISYLNSLYESDQTAPSSDEEDYSVWLSLFNVAVNLWEAEEGMLWKELFVKLADAADGSKTTTLAVTSYSVPSDFRFPASGYVWLGTGTNKTAYKVIKQENIQLYENNSENWCYFLMDKTPTLEFNPNIASSIPASYTISYNYYKNATKLASSSDTFEMSDPMFAVYYALSELKKDEGDTSAAVIASQKLEGMKTRNEMPTWIQSDSGIENNVAEGFGV